MRKKFEIYSYVSIGIVAVLLVLMIFKLVPNAWFIYILGFSIILMVIRFSLRIYYGIQDRKNKMGG
ncbi:MAG: hypothetical protein ABI550_01455 [Ignavibacteriaceae bacterium]